MHMLRLPLAEYFECPEDAVESVLAGLGRIAREGQRKYSGVPLALRGVATSDECAGDIFLDFTVPEMRRTGELPEINSLRADVLGLLEQVPGASAGNVPSCKEYKPQISLMQQSDLPASVFDSAVEFAGAVVRDLQIPSETRGWQLVLLRFESEAAGDDWSRGGWAADLRWNLLASHPI